MPYHYLQNYAGLRLSRSEFDLSKSEKRFERHCHDTYELIYILQGAGKYVVEGMEYPLHPHALLLMCPYEYHYVCPSNTESYERIVINFDASLLPKNLQVHPMLQKHHGSYFSLSEINNPVRSAYEALEHIILLSGGGMESTPEAEAFLHATVTQILLLLTLETPTTIEKKQAGTMLAVIEYLNAHLKEELSLDALAKEFFISKYHLCRMFHQQTGASIFTYFNTKRIALAQQMLAQGESATSVAMQLGFRDYSTFYRTYKKQTGLSPVRKIRTQNP